jgi:hypothetical protein
LPTLSPEQRKNNIIDLLKFNKGCDFPCWWGIQPGVTSVRDALSLSAELGEAAAPLVGPGPHGYYFSLSLDDLSFLDLSVDILDKDNTVDVVEAALIQPARLTEYEDALQQLSAKSILRRYGTPSDVVLTVSPPAEGGDVAGYQLWIAYKHLGFMVEYFGTTRFEDPLKICAPRTADPKLEHVNLTMQDPRSDFDLLRRIESYFGFKPLEGNSNMNIEEFTTLFSSDDPNPCFSTPLEIWP